MKLQSAAPTLLLGVPSAEWARIKALASVVLAVALGWSAFLSSSYLRTTLWQEFFPEVRMVRAAGSHWLRKNAP